MGAALLVPAGGLTMLGVGPAGAVENTITGLCLQVVYVGNNQKLYLLKVIIAY